MPAKLTQYLRHDRINPTQKMASWDAPFQVKQLKQLTLIASLSTHHHKPQLPDASSTRNHCSPKITSLFFNSIGQGRKWAIKAITSASARIVLQKSTSRQSTFQSGQ